MTETHASPSKADAEKEPAETKAAEPKKASAARHHSDFVTPRDDQNYTDAGHPVTD